MFMNLFHGITWGKKGMCELHPVLLVMQVSWVSEVMLVRQVSWVSGVM